MNYDVLNESHTPRKVTLYGFFFTPEGEPKEGVIVRIKPNVAATSNGLYYVNNEVTAFSDQAGYVEIELPLVEKERIFYHLKIIDGTPLVRRVTIEYSDAMINMFDLPEYDEFQNFGFLGGE